MAAATVSTSISKKKRSLRMKGLCVRTEQIRPDLPVRPARSKMALALRLHPRASSATQLISYIWCTQIFSSTLISSERHLSLTRFSSRVTKAAASRYFNPGIIANTNLNKAKGQTTSTTTTTTINDVVRSPPLPRGPVNDLARNRLLRQSRVRPSNNAAILTAVYINE